MASLIDCLIEDLTNENDGYEKLLDLSNDKTSAIVSGNVEKLQEIFIREQKLIEEIDVYENVNVEMLSSILSATASELILYVPADIRALMSLTLSSLTSEASLTAVLAVLYTLAVSDNSYLSFSVFFTAILLSLA